MPDQSRPQHLTVHYVPDFLPADLHQTILEYAIANQSRFQPTTTTDGIPNYRSSKVLFDFPFDEWLLEPLSDQLNYSLNALSLLPFPIAQVEHQLTASGDGDFYKRHSDNGDPTTTTRFLTFVYYLFQEPCPFTGGELVVYGHEEVELLPASNSLVMFASCHEHEILPVHNDGAWEHSRFTINGWYRMGNFASIPTLEPELLEQISNGQAIALPSNPPKAELPNSIESLIPLPVIPTLQNLGFQPTQPNLPQP